MKQLVQLQGEYASFEKNNAELIAVFREEEKGTEGLLLSLKHTKADFPLLLDPKSEKTKSYSQEGFATYVVDKRGIVRAVLPGTKTRRPLAERTLETVKEIEMSAAIVTPGN